MSKFSRARILPSVAVAVSVSVVLTGCAKSAPHSAPPAAAFAATPVAAAPVAAPSTPAPSTPSAASTTRAKAVPPPVTPQLKAIGLQRGDLPAAWKAAAPDPDPDPAASSAEMAQCAGGRDNYPDETGDSNSDEYSLGDATIDSDVSSFRSQADVEDDIAIIKNPNVDACYVKLAEGEPLPAGTSLDSASFLITPGSAGGPSNVVATGVGKLEISGDSGQVLDLYLNVAMIVGPSMEAEVDFSNVGTPVPPSLRNALIAKVAARAAKASVGAQT